MQGPEQDDDIEAIDFTKPIKLEPRLPVGVYRIHNSVGWDCMDHVHVRQRSWLQQCGTFSYVRTHESAGECHVCDMWSDRSICVDGIARVGQGFQDDPDGTVEVCASCVEQLPLDALSPMALTRVRANRKSPV